MKNLVYNELLRRNVYPKITFIVSETTKSAEEFLEPSLETLRKASVHVVFLTESKEFPPGTNASEIWKSYKPIIEKQRKQAIFRLTGIVLIPPIILFIAGLSLSWVIGGFISRRNI